TKHLTNPAYTCVACPLWTFTFRGHRITLLAPAKGMRTLFAKTGLSGPSLKYCGVFRHVLFPQDQECYVSFCIARRKSICIFKESTVLRSYHSLNGKEG